LSLCVAQILGIDAAACVLGSGVTARVLSSSAMARRRRGECDDGAGCGDPADSGNNDGSKLHRDLPHLEFAPGARSLRTPGSPSAIAPGFQSEDAYLDGVPSKRFPQ